MAKLQLMYVYIYIIYIIIKYMFHIYNINSNCKTYSRTTKQSNTLFEASPTVPMIAYEVSAGHIP